MNIGSWLILLFIGLPLIELMLLIKIGTLIGFWSTILLCIGTGILGATLARIQGFLIIQKIQYEIQKGHMPKEEMLDGLLILFGGIVLLTPGILTDLWGFAMLVPLTRYGFKRLLRKWFDRLIDKNHYRMIHRDPETF